MRLAESCRQANRVVQQYKGESPLKVLIVEDSPIYRKLDSRSPARVGVCFSRSRERRESLESAAAARVSQASSPRLGAEKQSCTAPRREWQPEQTVARTPTQPPRLRKPPASAGRRFPTHSYPRRLFPPRGGGPEPQATGAVPQPTDRAPTVEAIT